MSFFAKKPEPEPLPPVERAVRPVVPEPKSGYGIADAIALMRSLPLDQNGELVIRVVRATLASLNVRLPQIIEDASRKQKVTQERITGIHGQIANLEKQLEGHKREITTLEADLKETTDVKERLQMAEKSAGSDVTAPVQIADKPDVYMRPA